MRRAQSPANPISRSESPRRFRRVMCSRTASVTAAVWFSPVSSANSFMRRSASGFLIFRPIDIAYLPFYGRNIPFSAHMSTQKRVAHQNRGLALRAGREHRHRRADQLLDAADIFHRAGGKVRPAARAARGAVPAFHDLVDGFKPRLFVGIDRKVIDLPAVEFVADADMDLLEGVEDVELGENDAIHAAGDRSEEHTS